MCGRPTTLGVLALMVAADGAHGLRTRAPGRRCPPRPPTTILRRPAPRGSPPPLTPLTRRSARCLTHLLIVFFIHSRMVGVDVLRREEPVSERSARDRRG